MESKDVFLAEGTYGKVYKCADNTVKKYLNIFEYGTINEIYMYYKYSSCPFIPKLNVISIKNECIMLHITYEGPTMSSYADTLSYNQRIELIPTLINQIGEMARWLKSKSIIHYDIKPENICINVETNIIKLIDFNFTIPAIRKNFKHCGTYVFCDPSYKKKTKDHSIQFDIFSFGMCLIYWINKKTYNMSKIKTNDDLRSLIKIELLDNVNNDYIKIILSMIDLNECNRIKAECIPIYKLNNINKEDIEKEERQDERRRKIKVLIKKEFREEIERESFKQRDPYYEWIIYKCLYEFESLGEVLHKNYEDSSKIIRYLCEKMFPSCAFGPIFR